MTQMAKILWIECCDGRRFALGEPLRGREQWGRIVSIEDGAFRITFETGYEATVFPGSVLSGFEHQPARAPAPDAPGATCICGGNPLEYEGPRRGCPMHDAPGAALQDCDIHGMVTPQTPRAVCPLCLEEEAHEREFGGGAAREEGT